MSRTSILACRLLCGASLLVTGCAETDTDSDDAEGDAFLIDGKMDAAGISEGSPEAKAVLAVANRYARDTLLDDVLLSTRSTDNIIAHRRGRDKKDGTADDNPFNTLSELDGVPYVGPVTFGRLVNYVLDHGLVAGSCAGLSVGDCLANPTCTILPTHPPRRPECADR